MGCYVDKTGQPQDACVISHDYSAPNTYYIFNHVDIIIRLPDIIFRLLDIIIRLLDIIIRLLDIIFMSITSLSGR